MRLRLLVLALAIPGILLISPQESAALSCAECRYQPYGRNAGCHLCIFVSSPGSCNCDMWGMGGEGCDQCIAYNPCTASCTGTWRWVDGGCSPSVPRLDVHKELARWRVRQDVGRMHRASV